MFSLSFIRINFLTLIFIGSISGTFAGTNDFYNFKWLDKDKSIYVLQNKVYTKKYSKYINLMTGSSNLSDFQDSSVLSAQLGYYFKEEWGFEVAYSTFNNSNNDSYDAIAKAAQFVPFVRKYESITALNLIFSPFYGKINTFNKIIYLDWSFGLGYSSIAAKSNKESFINSEETDRFEDESLTGFNIKTAWRIYFGMSIQGIVEYSKTYFSAEKPERGSDTKLFDSSDFTLGIGFSF